jgi:hypothetical protein
MVGPTAFPDLNAVLSELVGGVRSVLDENFCGAYLHGSFATGDADIFSDVDFIVVTHEELSGEQEAGLQATHRRIYTLETPWAQHLEGSYAPARRLRRMDWSGSPFFYLDNGSDRLVWDRHCNTAVVRWLLREHGLALAGPEPRTLLAPVSASELRREAVARVHDYVEWASEPTKVGPMSRWKQPYLVITLCRLLFTLHEGRIPSKGEAGAWALDRLDREWHQLVRRALDDRPNPWDRVHQPAAPDTTQRTLRFGDYAATTTTRWAEEHPAFE